MNGIFSAATLLLGLAAGSTAAAAGGTATDQAVSLTYGAAHWGSQPNADITGVDATGDPVVEVGMWYRAEGDTREYPLPPPDSETYLQGTVRATWNNVDGKNFELQETTYVFDNEGPSGGFVTWVSIVNHNATAKQFWLFHYLDTDVAASSGGDSGALVTPRFLKFSDGTSRVSYRARDSIHYQVATYPNLRTELNDTALDDLNDTGLPFGPGDATSAFEFSAGALNPGTSSVLAVVSAFFNPASDHVKGDNQGVLGQPPLYGQSADLSGQGSYWMRRTTQLPMSTWVSRPNGASISLAGTGDFDGDFVDEVVFRDMASGVAYVDLSPITGAPTLGVTWKLSATGDFNGDDKADILWRNTTSQKLVIWTMNGSAKVGAIIPSPDQAVAGNWEVAAASDFNGDGHRDLLWYNQTTGKIVLWYMDASVVRTTGTFTTPASVGNNNWRVRAVGDYGRGLGGVYDTQDIVWQNDTSKKIVVWHMDQGATRTSGLFTVPAVLPSSWDLVGPR